jgi:hypothetical protein
MIALDTNVLIYACDKATPACAQIALDLITNTADAINCGRSHVSSSPHHEVWIATDLRPPARGHDFSGRLPVSDAERQRRPRPSEESSPHTMCRSGTQMILWACLDAGVRTLTRRVSLASASSAPPVNPFK